MNTTRSRTFASSLRSLYTAAGLATVAWLLLTNEASAQWAHASDLQTPVCAVVGASVFDTRVISDGAGGFYAVWTDTRNSATGYDIYAQRIGANGRQLWTLNGVEVARTASIQDQPLIAADGAGGVVT